MSHEQLSIRTSDGDCPAHIFKPEGSGPWPAAIFYMDGLGIRPTLFEMGQRLANGWARSRLFCSRGSRCCSGGALELRTR